jgi:rhodanese-related sulfurtransferase
MTTLRLAGAMNADDCAEALAPEAVAARLTDRDAPEWAFLDVREEGEAADGHPFGAVNAPFSRLEAALCELVPRSDTPLVLLDGGDGVASRAAAALRAVGRREVAVVMGGAPGWAAAGLPLLKGVNTFSKAFGEWVERSFHVPSIGPDDLEAARRIDPPPRLIDGRPFAEHAAFTIPGARSCPNGELALRLPMIAGPDEVVVVHCAGRTRSIIGAQTLRDFGVPNAAFALRDGTQGWELSGRPRALAAPSEPAPEPDGLAIAAAQARARDVIARSRLPVADAATLDRWLIEGRRTVLRLDPRPEGEGDPPPGFRRAPATTLIQATDRFVAVRGARVALWDPLLARAVFAALWLRRMGIDAWVIDGPPPAVDARPAPAVGLPCPPLLGRSELGSARAILDLRPSAAFAAARLPGAVWSIRPRLPELRDAVLLAADPDVGAAAFTDLDVAGLAPRGLFLGGPDIWRAAGLTVDETPAPQPDAPDAVRFCAGRHAGDLEDARAYLAWEKGLLDQLEAAGLRPWPAPTSSESTGASR